MIKGNGPKWLFDLDSLTQSMNYVPVVAGNSSNDFAGIQGVSESSTSSQQDQDWIAIPIWKDASYFGDASPNIVDDAQIEDKDELHDEDDATEESHDGSNLKENGTADQQANTARPYINTSSREVSTALPEVNTATPEDLVGPSPASEDSHVEDQEIKLGNIPQSYEVPTTPHIRIHKDHPIEHVLGDVQSLSLRAISTKWVYRRNKKDEKEIVIRNKARLIAQEEGIDYDEIYVDDIIFGSTKKELCDEFEKLMKDKFQMSFHREFAFILGITSPSEKERDAADVDEHIYRSMIGSLMYLIASRPDIMFAVSCVLFVHTVSGLWYSKDSPLELVAYTDSDYAGATQDRKSTICELLQVAVDRSAEASTDDNGDVQITAIIDGHSMSITEASLRRHLKLDDQDGITSIPNSEIFEQLALMGYHTDSDKLTFQKGAFSPQWRFLIVNNNSYCLSPKKTAWEQFSSSNICNCCYCQEVTLFPTMLDVSEPFTSPSKITSLPSHSPESSPSHSHVPSTQTSLVLPTAAASQPSPSQPSPTQPSPGAEHHFPTPHDSPLHAIHSHGSDEGSLKLNELTNLVTKLSDRIGVLEDDLRKTKKTYSSAFTKLILRKSMKL
ncbi:hypothetical protein Tco_0541435 [Tanacetum coccineum]